MIQNAQELLITLYQCRVDLSSITNSSRELSITITKIDEATMWLERHIELAQRDNA